ncbi:MAG: WYL domain-containing transcriptional regulator [Lachnospiraceae bacterium]|nr:WYL domain-containing transcriptional regulator [Lachnospiraceae bacterium]
MAKNSGQKLKLLYIVQILSQETDEAHAITTQKLIERLEAQGVSAERKSIYDDIAKLQDFGYDIIQKDNRTGGGYYLASREFEVAELKLLVDAVQSSRFITEKKSRELIGKLEKLVSKHEAKQLQRQVYVAGRVKTENESIYYQIDALHKAIQENRQIRFAYMEWNRKKELVPRSKTYRVSPWILMWNDENYYLVAYDEAVEGLRHYRMDKLADVEILDETRVGQAYYEGLNPVEYVNKTFGMFGGVQEDIVLTFPERLVGVIIDRFGKEVSIRPEGELLRARVKVMASEQFYGWLAGLGTEVRIVSPSHVKDSYREWLKELFESQLQ